MALLPTEPVNRTILLIDIEDYSSRGNHQQVHLRRRLHEVTDGLLAAVGSGPDQTYREDRGDCLIVLVSAEIPKTKLLRELLRIVPEVLRTDNGTVTSGGPMRLRVIMAAGEVLSHPNEGTVGGIVGHDLNQAFRLLDAAVLREALRLSDADCVLAVSSSVYEGVIHHSYKGLRPEEFNRFVATVKRDRVEGWLHGPLPRTPESPPPAGPGGHRKVSRNDVRRARRVRRVRRVVGVAVGALVIGGAIGWVLTPQGARTPWARQAAQRPTPSASPGSSLPGRAGPAPNASPRPETSPSDPARSDRSAGGRTVYREYFGTMGLWTDHGHFKGASYGRSSYLVFNEPSKDRGYRIGLPEKVPRVFPRGPENVGIEVLARLNEDATVGYGAVCRAGADKSGYYFTIWGAGARIERRLPGSRVWDEPLEAVERPDVIKTVGENRLQVSCVDTAGGVRLGFRVNGTEVAVATDTSPSPVRTGSVALAAGSDASTEVAGTAEFTGFVVRQL
ncbi:hypothetical protein ACMZ5F_13670 [Streptomyces rhizosphaericola]|uniref:hypothetical protein n=1 Tax=Streptomyces TaxID=1883 RepID=UPI00067BECE6|nr:MULTISPECIES: hypothetical protein [unclassified Streptomyces]MYT90812.1 hypothetical protein [Streptomyces sp. SID8359]